MEKKLAKLKLPQPRLKMLPLPLEATTGCSMLLPQKPNQPRVARPNSRNKKEHKLEAHQRNQQPADSQELGKHPTFIQTCLVAMYSMDPKFLHLKLERRDTIGQEVCL